MTPRSHGQVMTPAERRVRAHCPAATLEIRERSDAAGWIVVVTHDGTEYAGSGSTVAAAWEDAAGNLGLAA